MNKRLKYNLKSDWVLFSVSRASKWREWFDRSSSSTKIYESKISQHLDAWHLAWLDLAWWYACWGDFLGESSGDSLRGFQSFISHMPSGLGCLRVSVLIPAVLFFVRAREQARASATSFQLHFITVCQLVKIGKLEILVSTFSVVKYEVQAKFKASNWVKYVRKFSNVFETCLNYIKFFPKNNFPHFFC